ncbi:hypothetical protein BGZ83_001901 [Gryganskiella cystojenkinii]|nr:hypothetical protein BGZ83_001901 [Gryganskiella cystojenkinii]
MHYNIRRIAVLAVIVCSALVVSAAPITEVDEDTRPTFESENNLNRQCPDVCKGVKPLNSTAIYLCGDPRLGPKKLPRLFPLDDITHPYDRFGGLCAAEFLAKWTVNGSYTYPPSNGFQLNTDNQPIQGNITLLPGALLDRFGSEYGKFLSPAEAPYPQRALPPSNLDTPQGPDQNKYPYNYHVYKVVKNLIVLSGPIAPWFGQAGQGVQYNTQDNILTLIANGFLERVPLKL